MMKKTTFGAALAFLAAAAGALTAVAISLYRREKELDEYEQLLFSDEDDLEEEETVYEDLPDEEADGGDAADAGETAD